jgi:surface protein
MSNSLLQIKSLLFIICLLTVGTVSNAQDRPFITVWQTDNPGTSEDNQITIPGTGTDYLIEWEEVGNEANNNGSETGTDEHTVTFPSAGTYRVKISGELKGIKFQESEDRRKIIGISAWGDIVWMDLQAAFAGCIDLKYDASDSPDLSLVSDLSQMFSGARIFNGNLNNWNVSNITNMSHMFSYTNSFNGDISSWDVSNVTDMNSMFLVTDDFNSDIGNWDVSNVTDMSKMFAWTEKFNGDISSWDVSNVVDMQEMFQLAESFNTDISRWDVSSVRNMEGMFASAEVFNSAIGGWDVSNVTTMESMFYQADSFNQDLTNWSVNSVNTMRLMFNGAQNFNGSLETWNVSNVEDMMGMFAYAHSFNQNLEFWDVSNVTNMGDMFRDAKKFRSQLNDWNVSNVTDMSNMFTGAEEFNSDITEWDVSRVQYMYGMFRNAKLFDQNLENWDISSVSENMSSIFEGTSLSTYNYDNIIIGWSKLPDVPSGINFAASGMKYCISKNARKYLEDEKGWMIRYDIKSCEEAYVTIWDPTLGNVANPQEITIPISGHEYMLYWEAEQYSLSNGYVKTDRIHKLTLPESRRYRIIIMSKGGVSMSTTPDSLRLVSVENWGDIKWKSLSGAFIGANNLQFNTTDLPDFSNLEDMSKMFKRNISFNAEISNWDVSNVTNMTEMFREAKTFNQDISTWNTAKVTDISGMFYEATSFDQDLGDWNLSNAGSLFEFLTNAGLSAQNYDATLEGWASNGTIPTDIALSAEGLIYCASDEFRQQLIDDFGWGITGDVQCSLVLEETFPVAEATHVEKNTEIYLTFDQTFEEIDFSKIELSDVLGNSVTINNIVADSLTLRIIHNGLGFNTYEVTIPENTLVSASGKVNDEIKWSFATQSILAAKGKQLATNLANYPNPFSDYTTLRFSLTEGNSFDLLVYDVKGHLVRQESYSNRASGEQSIKFERKGLPTGLYHYQIQATQGAVSGKMMIK